MPFQPIPGWFRLVRELTVIGWAQLDHLVSALLNFLPWSWLMTGFQGSVGICLWGLRIGTGTQSLRSHLVDQNVFTSLKTNQNSRVGKYTLFLKTFFFLMWTIPKNWCFWTVVREKTLGSPLDCKEIKPVNPKGNLPCLFIGRTDAPILWPPDEKSWLIRKAPDAGKNWKQEEKGMTEDDIAG